MSYTNDKEYQDVEIKKAEAHEDGSYTITREDGFCFHVPKESPVIPRPGMTARFYGRRLGTVRGLFLDGTKVYYRTKEQQKKHQDEEIYGKDIHEWLRRWDDGKPVWTIEMGGLGPGYEQAIQILAAEIVRHLIETGADWGEDDAEWKRVRQSLDPIISKVGKEIGFSGAQVGAAVGLACNLYLQGPIAVMMDDAVKDRHILVSRRFPNYPTPSIKQ